MPERPQEPPATTLEQYGNGCIHDFFRECLAVLITYATHDLFLTAPYTLTPPVRMNLALSLRRVLPLALVLAVVMSGGPRDGVAANAVGEVRRAQEALQQKGLDIGRPDGVMGARTRNAVREFQRANGLPATGKFDGPTLRLLGIGQPVEPAHPSEPAMPKPAEPAPPPPPAPAAEPAKPPPEAPAATPFSPQPATPEQSGNNTAPVAVAITAVLGAIIWYLRRRSQRQATESAFRDGEPDFLAPRVERAPTPPQVPAPPLSPSGTNRRKAKDILNQQAGLSPVPASPLLGTQADSAGWSNLGLRQTAKPATPCPPAPVSAETLRHHRWRLLEILRLRFAKLHEKEPAAREVNDQVAWTAPAALTAPEPPLSPGEINRRKVEEILGRRATLLSVPSAPLLGAQADSIDWSNLGLGRTVKPVPSPPPSPPSPPPPTLRTPSNTWRPPSERVTIAGFVIPDGMIYVGTRLPRLDGAGAENCLIDPSLPVRAAHAAPTTYFPAYARIDPAQRHAYLRWLAEGRRAPDIDMGYVFLFFYGLERRLIGDRSASEAPTLIAEVERLRSIYGRNASFARYSADLLAMARLLYGNHTDEPPLLDGRLWEMPLDVKVGLGHMVAEGKPVPGSWVLAWLHCDTELPWRTPATRAAEEFKALFLNRFAAQFPNGLPVKPPKRKLRPAYRACSGTFTATATIEVGGAELPDVSALTAPLTKVRPIAEVCMADLDAYSRFLGKAPERRDSLEAFALLPAELRNDPPPAVRGIATWLDGAVSAPATNLPFADVARRLLGQAPEKPAKRDMQLLAMALGALGYGLEPDPAFGGRTPRPGEPVAVFRRNAEEPGPLTDVYRAALLRLTLTVLVAHADGTIADEERALLAAHIADDASLTDADRRRLAAHLHWLAACPPELASLKARAAMLPIETRADVGQLAIAVATADGHIDPDEVKLLQKLYKALDLDPDAVFSHLHALGAGDRPAGPAAAPSAPAASTVQLDPERIRRIQADTARVSGVLGAIFVDEVTASEPLPAPEPEPEETDDDRFAGLDPQHRELLHELLAAESWARCDYEVLARSLDLMPDGAIETINEWSFDRFGDAVLEDGDPLTVVASLLPTPELEPIPHV
ncbi:plasma membrane H+-transporting two-sector ATPase (plasmid) [Azospirillum argentinense]|uniref:Plasma membrane H+-transporting two-sector ATPase n=1 Tax=Azospirillum argentinense TaxID=2970906 RepID=A0A4D8PP07_9PROT|nr:plasma membrane H+-transporting two-sector ATPase [Azospirillum argentinense]